jgi:hypothetical protein
MNDTNSETTPNQPSIHFGHLGIIALSVFLLLGFSYMEKPQLFSFKKTNTALADANIPHYYPYVTPAADQPQPEVLGASTDQGPQIIGDDGTVQSVSLGQVLAASTDGVQLSLDSVQVNTVPDSAAAIQQYFTQSQKIEGGMAGDTDFASALNSGDQTQINAQAQKITAMVAALQKLPVPQSLAQLQKLQIIQYNSAIQMLQNFTNADQNPDQITQDTEQFLKSEQDLETESANIAQKFPTMDPLAGAYVDSNGNLLPTPTPQAVTNSADGSSLGSQSDQSNLNNLDNSDAGQ